MLHMARGLTDGIDKQPSIFDAHTESRKIDKLDDITISLQRKYGLDIVKSGSEMISEKRLQQDRTDGEE